MPVHQFYADGTPRPLCRGWLHGLAAIVALPSLWIYWNWLPYAAKPGLVAICATLTLSSMLHLYPFRDPYWESIATKLDHTSIAVVTGVMLWTPQFLENHESSSSCKPSLAYATSTILLPSVLAAAGVWLGWGPEKFLGSIVATLAGLWHYSQLNDQTVFVLTSISGILYLAGFAMFVQQTGGHAKIWGFHEWMHVFVTIAFCINAHGMLHISTFWVDGLC